MFEFKLKACIVCFSTKSLLLDIACVEFRLHFYELAGLQPADFLLKTQYLCKECCELVEKFHKFREKCVQAHIKLQEIITKAQQDIKTGASVKNVSRAKFPHVVIHEGISGNNEDKLKLKTPEPTCIPPLLCVPLDGSNETISPSSDHHGILYKEECQNDAQIDISNETMEPASDHDDYKEEYIDNTIFESDDEVPLSPTEFNEIANQHNQIMREDAPEDDNDSDLQMPKITCKVCCKSFNVKPDKLIQKNKKMVAEKFVCQVCLPLVKLNWDACEDQFVKIIKAHKSVTRNKNDFFKKKKEKDPEDFLKYSPVSHQEQYRIIHEREFNKHEMCMNQCQICYKSHNSHNAYKNHMKKHDPTISGYIQCDVCKECKKSKYQMRKHMETRHINRWTCTVDGCLFVTCNKSRANSHYNYHKNVKFQCPYCNQIFDKRTTYLSHLRFKHPSHNVLCNLCGNCFISKLGLLQHRKLTHTKEDIKLAKKLVVDPTSELYCSYCMVQFVFASAFERHAISTCKIVRDVFVPTEPPPSPPPPRNPNDKFICEECGRAFKQKGNLKSHTRVVHSKEKPFNCSQCDHKFGSANNRDRHIIVHHGKKPYQCQYCSRGFAKRKSMLAHMQTAHLKIPHGPCIGNVRKKQLAKQEKKSKKSTRRKSIEQDCQEVFVSYNED